MKPYRFLIVLLVVIVALPFAGRLFWMMKKSKTIDIVIINKSVEKSSQNELKALNWTLNSEKYKKSSGDFYNYRMDYFGYFPDAISEDRKIVSFKLEDVSSIAQSASALFFIDNAGVKFEETKKKFAKPVQYGGFNQNDYFLLKEMVNRQKLVVAEYNFFSPPTEDLVKYNTEQFLDIYSLGWDGKYFYDLSKEAISGSISTKWFDQYKLNYSSDWEFSGPGIILLNKGQNRIIVLPSGKFMNSKFPDVVTSPDLSTEFNVPGRASYDGWFEIAYEGKNRVISNINLNLNQEGIDILRKNGIEPEFPAVIEAANKKFYYMAGDFSKSRVFMPYSKLGFISEIAMSIEKSGARNPERFFAVYYNNILSSILKDYYSEISVSVK